MVDSDALVCVRAAFCSPEALDSGNDEREREAGHEVAVQHDGARVLVGRRGDVLREGANRAEGEHLGGIVQVRRGCGVVGSV